MRESTTESPPQQRRANWVGLRTLRQRPKLVGTTPSGEPIYEARSVRLVLRGNAEHFIRLEECAKCGKAVAGRPILTSADLTKPSNTVICTDCVRAATVPRAHSGSPPPAATASRAEPEVGAEDDSRQVGREAQLNVVLGRLDAVEAQQRDGAVSRRLTQTASQVELVTRRVEAMEGDVRRSLTELRDLLEGQRQELAALAGASAAARDDIGRLSEAQQRLASVGDAVERRLVELVAHAADEGPTETWAQDFECRLAGLAEVIDGLRSDMHAALARVVDELMRAQSEQDARLADVVRWSHLAQAQLDASLSVAPAIEERLQTSFEAVTAQVETLRRELEGERAAAMTVDPAEAESIPSSGLLADLDRQLTEAERRLAQRFQSDVSR